MNLVKSGNSNFVSVCAFHTYISWNPACLRSSSSLLVYLLCCYGFHPTLLFEFSRPLQAPLKLTRNRFEAPTRRWVRHVTVQSPDENPTTSFAVQGRLCCSLQRPQRFSALEPCTRKLSSAEWWQSRGVRPVDFGKWATFLFRRYRWLYDGRPVYNKHLMTGEIK